MKLFFKEFSMKKVFYLSLFLVIFGFKYVYPEDFDFDEYWLYIGLRAGGSIYFYDPSYKPISDYFKNRENTIDNSGAFAGGIQFNIQFFNNFSLQTEILYTKDNPSFIYEVFYKEGSISFSEAHQMHMLTMPVLARWSYRSGVLRLGLYTGIYFNVPLGKIEVIFVNEENSSLNERRNEYKINYNSSPGFMIGGYIGLEGGGPGKLFLDIRYGIDFIGTKVEYGAESFEFRRSGLNISLGYEFGVIGKRK
jgi:hypothetical protein